MAQRSFVIDTDTASDDAVALMLAMAEPTADVRAVTIVAGNVPLDLAIDNAIVTLDLMGGHAIPVHRGAAGPAHRPLDTAQMVHGEDGMGGAELPEPSRSVDPEPAVDALVRIARTEPGEHVLVTLGPLTNIAAAIDREPGFLAAFQHTYFMAGSPDGVGNVDTLGEYNVWADPEAASVVFASDGPKTMIGWNISRTQAVMTPDETARLRACGPLGAYAVDINADVEKFCLATGLAGMDLPDPVAMAVALDDSIIVRSTDDWVVVGLDDPTRGAVLPDRRIMAHEPNMRVVWEVDEARFKQRLYDACSG